MTRLGRRVLLQPPTMEDFFYTTILQYSLNGIIASKGGGPCSRQAAATILQLVDFSTKVLARVNEFQSRLREIPKSFRHISNAVLLLCDTFNRFGRA
jgi:hypothetical protein